MKNNELLISVVMPAYNAAHTIVASIRSLQAQTHNNWELLVVDDNSADNTVSIIQELAHADKRIKLIRLLVNSGRPAHPRNMAIREARGDFIAFLDADDQWLSDKLNKQIDFMLGNGSALSCTGYFVIDSTDQKIGNFVPPAISSYENLLSRNTIGCLTAMYNVDILGKKYFPICGHEDYALWLSILRSGYQVHGLQEKLSCYRISPGSVSSDKVKILKFFWNIYRNLEGFSYFTSAYFCFRYVWNNRRKYK